MGAAHEADFPKLDVADAGKDGMRGDVRHEKGAEARRTVSGVNDDIEHESLEGAVGENAGEGQKLPGVRGDNSEDEIGMLEHRVNIRKGATPAPPREKSLRRADFWTLYGRKFSRKK